MSRDSRIFFTSGKFWVLSSLVTLLLLSLLGNFLSDEMFKFDQKNHSDSLKTLVESGKTSLVSSVESLKRESTYWSMKKEVIDFSIELTKIKNKASKLKKKHSEVYSKLNPTKDLLNYEGYFIVSLDGINLASGRQSNVGSKSILLKDKPIFERVKKGEVLVTKLLESDIPLKDRNGKFINKRATIFVAAPVYNYEGTIIAIGALRINPYSTIWKILESEKTGDTGETYIVDVNGFMQSPSRFQEELKLLKPMDDTRVLKYRVTDLNGKLTYMAESISSRKMGSNFVGYDGHRGAQVIGHWDWIEELNLGVVSEIEYKEAFYFYSSFRFLVWGFCFVISMLIIYGIRITQKKVSSYTEKTYELENLSEKVQGLAHIGGWQVSTFDDKKSWTNELYNIFELPFESNIQEVGQSDFYIGTDKKRFKDQFYKCKHLGLAFEDEFEIVTFKGTKKWLRTSAEAVFDKDANIIKILGTVQDITESVIKASEAKSLFESIDSSAIVGVTDIKGRITYANDHFCKISKFSKEELIGQNHRILNSGEHDKEFFRDLWNTILKGESWSGEVKNKAKDGSFYWTFSTISPNFDANENITGYTAIRTDITKNKEMEAQIEQERAVAIHSSKLALIGEMSSGMAHEINNPLTVISGNTMLIKKAMKETDEKVSKNINQIEKSVKRITKIIDSVRKFSRKEESLVQTSNKANTILDETMSIIKAKSFKQTVDVRLLEVGENEVMCDALAMEQVLVNLISNAIDENETKKDAWVEVSFNHENNHDQFIVRDCGEGIDDSKLKSIFNPFFTTKDIGKGTGLGLSISKGIVEDHGGSLEYRLIDGHTAFVVSLPSSVKMNIAS